MVTSLGTRYFDLSRGAWFQLLPCSIIMGTRSGNLLRMLSDSCLRIASVPLFLKSPAFILQLAFKCADRSHFYNTQSKQIMDNVIKKAQELVQRNEYSIAAIQDIEFLIERVPDSALSLIDPRAPTRLRHLLQSVHQ